MKTRLIINKFNRLNIEHQKEIQDFICGFTTNWKIEEIKHNDCDLCSNPKNLELKKVSGCDFVMELCLECEKDFIKQNVKE